MSSKERKALGRGFGALLKSVDEYTSQDKGSGVFEVDIEEISVNPKQPRRNIDEVKLQELAQSIKTRGVIQPILVRLKENSEKK
ncbi:ParB N-terminal domain-containing protein, partial [bacterium]|nr:ParB N-terminal domain-containing protein [bacterium]